MSKDILVEQHNVLTFKANVELAAQRFGPKLRKYVTEMSCSGEGAVAANVLNPIAYVRGARRKRSNITTTAERTRRWLVYRDPIEVGDYIDSVDVFQQTQEPTSELIENGMMAIGRGIDNTILGLNDDGTIGEGGLLGAVYAGKRPSSANTPLPAANITVHGSTGLTIAKLRAARKALGLREGIDLDRVNPIVAITEEQHDNLLGIVESSSANFNQLEQPQIVNGRVNRLLTFDIVIMNGLPKTGAIRSCPVWVKSAVKLGVWQDVRSRMWKDTSADNLPYWKIDAYMDATRPQDDGVHVIECQEP